MAGCRAVWLVDKVITGPLWRKLKESAISVLQMTNVYSEMKNKFGSWSNDANGLIKGKAKLESAGEIHINEVWTALIETCEEDIDTLTIELLQILFGTFSVTTQREVGVRPICQHNFGNNRMLKEPRIMLE